MKTFKLPDLGEGLQDAEIIEWQVNVDDVVAVDQVIVVVETAKAIVELPSPSAGRIAKLCAAAGETVQVGQTLIEYESSEEKIHSLEPEDSVSVVGVLPDVKKGGESTKEHFLIGAESAKQSKRPNVERSNYTISPDLLAFARQLDIEHELPGLDEAQLSKVKLVELYEKKQVKAANSETHSEFKENSIIPLKGTKKIMAQAMMKSHQHVPAVTLFDDAHIAHWVNQDITVRVLGAMVDACRSVPLLNAWFDEEAMSIQTFTDLNIGVAVDSKDGLFVPVLREAQKLKPDMMRKLVDKMIKDVKKRSIKPQKLLGATISLSNFGTLSGRYATPIIVPPQVAIVGVGRIRQEPVVKNGTVEVETVMPLSLSFDHRAATGAEAAEFLSVMIQSLESA